MTARPDFSKLGLSRAYVLKELLGSARKLFKEIKTRTTSVSRRDTAVLANASKRTSKQLQDLKLKFIGAEVPSTDGGTLGIVDLIFGEAHDFYMLTSTRDTSGFWLKRVRNMVITGIYNIDELYFELSKVIDSMDDQVSDVVSEALSQTGARPVSNETTMILPRPSVVPLCRRATVRRGLCLRKVFE